MHTKGSLGLSVGLGWRIISASFLFSPSSVASLTVPGGQAGSQNTLRSAISVEIWMKLQRMERYNVNIYLSMGSLYERVNLLHHDMHKARVLQVRPLFSVHPRNVSRAY